MTTGTMNVNVGSAYQASFGNLPHNTVYCKSNLNWNNREAAYDVDLRNEMHKIASVNMKAMGTTTGGAGTAGYAMIPVYLDPQIVDQTRKNTPLCELIPRVTNMGITADYNNVTAKGGAFTASEDAALSETNTTTDRFSTPIKYLYAVGRVTGQAVASYPSYLLQGFQPQAGAVSSFDGSNVANAKQLEVQIKARELKELEENLIINGNATTNGVSGNTGPNGSEFSGIITLMGATNTVDKNTAALTLDDINTAIRYAFDDGGRPNLAVCSSGVYTDLMNLLHAKIGFLQSTQTVFWGFQTIVLHTMVGDIPVIPSMFMSNVSGSKAIYFLDMSVVEMRVLQDMTYVELAKTNDSEKFMLKMYEALIIRNTSFCSSITEISA